VLRFQLEMVEHETRQAAHMQNTLKRSSKQWAGA